MCCRIVWLVLVLSSWGFVIRLLIMSMIRTYGSDVNTRISIEKARTLQFPSVTICNYNQYRRSYFQSADNYTKSILLSTYPDSLTISRSLLKLNETETQGFNATKVFIESAHQIQKLAVLCVWQKHIENCSEVFTKVFTDHGVCYTFNSDGRRFQSSAGSLNGLQLILNIEDSEYFYSENMGTAGVKVNMLCLKKKF